MRDSGRDSGFEASRPLRSAVMATTAALGLLILSGIAATAQLALGDAAARAAAAATPAALAELAGSLRHASAGAGTGAQPDTLAQSAEALGHVVARARELNAPEELFRTLLADAERLAGGVSSARESLEERAGEDEVALETLYRSSSWQRLGYADSLLRYWKGWGQLGRAQQLSPGPERRAGMERATRAFSRTALELRLPRMASASLLGLGMAQRDLGRRDTARRTLTRLLTRLEREGDAGGESRGAAHYELAQLALEEGDPVRARRHFAQVGEDQLSRERRDDFALRAVALTLDRAARDGATPAALDGTAEQLRRLLTAGGSTASRAAALLRDHWPLLGTGDRDFGPFGELLRAERAYTEKRYGVARESYARVLGSQTAVPGLQRSNVQYRYAHSLAEAGDPVGGLERLDALVREADSAAIRGLAARRAYALAEQLAAADSGAAAQQRALRAAEALLRVDPEAASADSARYRVARAKEARGDSRSVLAELEHIGVESTAYPQARLRIARLRGERLQRLEARGPSRRLRTAASQLLAELERVAALIAAGRLAADRERDLPLSLLAAKAAFWSGAPGREVTERIAAVRSYDPDRDGAVWRALLRLELRLLRRERQWSEIEARLLGRGDAELRSELPLWREVLEALDGDRAAPATLRLAGYQRVLSSARGKTQRRDLAPGHIAALLDTGRAAEAVSAARRLTEAEPDWAEAWILYARALEAAGDDAGALRAWAEVAEGIAVDTGPGVEARLRVAELALRLGETEQLERFCGDFLEDLNPAPGQPEPAITPAQRQRLDAAAAGCMEAGAR